MSLRVQKEWLTASLQDPYHEKGYPKEFSGDMAESAVSFLLAKLNDLVAYETGLILGLRKDIRSLQSQLQWIRSFLRDAERKSKENELLKIWVSQVRDVAYDAEDVIDAFIIQKRYDQGFLHRFIHLPYQWGISHTFDAQIKDIKTRIEEISANKTKFCIESIQGGGETSHPSLDSRPPPKQAPTNFVEEADVVGVEDDVKSLERRLTTALEKRRVVVSITGMGGLGKTTLARKLYRSTTVSKHFDSIAWITISQDYNMKALLRQMIQNLKALPKDEDLDDEEMLRQMLAEYLKEKRYLIVVDDIWSMRAWDELLPAFPDQMNGSRVVLTTRNKEIALYADAVSVPHELKLLPENKSWELFCNRAFPGSTGANCPSELERLAKDIVAKCGGLPLAIVVVGGLLSRQERTPSKWEKLYKSIPWHLREGESNIAGILDLSYHDLPYYLKSCFLYCGVFPEDAEIPATKLMRLWIAEGFVQNRGAETLEEVAEDYLEELICRSMIQVAGKRFNGQVKTCRLHDILRDLAISEAKEGKLYGIYQHGESATSLEVVEERRLIAYNGDFTLPSSSNHLRTILTFSKDGHLNQDCLRNLVNHSKFLRVLDLEGVKLSGLPAGIRNLVHLHYLGLRRTGVKSLKGCIGESCHLQTLDIRESNCRKLPEKLWKSRSLRHLWLGRCSFQNSRLNTEARICFPEQVEIENMSNLETLTGVAAGKWIDSLGKLTNLRRLGIGQLSGVDVVPLETSLPNLSSLSYLWLEGKTVPALKLAGHYNLYKMHLLGCLEKLPNLKDFPENLTSLLLQNSRLKEDPFLVLMELPRLKVLGLLKAAYMGQSLKCFKGGFQQLEELTIQLSELEDWEVYIGSLPKLKSMSLVECQKLLALPQGVAYMTTLRNLNLIDMPRKFTRQLREPLGGSDFWKIERLLVQSLRLNVIDSSIEG